MVSILALVAAFIASILTFFTGFGLGTVLLAVFVLIFPVYVAIAATAVVHLVSNVSKLLLVAKHIRRDVFLRFGIPALIAAVAGAYTLSLVENIQQVFAYDLAGKHLQTTPLRILIGLLMAAFALVDLSGLSQKWLMETRWMPLGGVLSGYFGGLSGNQGAFRTMFLLKAGLQKEELIATGAGIGLFVDVGRLCIYWSQINGSLNAVHWPLLSGTIAAAIAGTVMGNKLLKKVSIKNIEAASSILVLAIAAGLCAGLI